MKTHGNLYLAPFLLELEMLQKKHSRKNQNTLRLPQFTDRLTLRGLQQLKNI